MYLSYPKDSLVYTANFLKRKPALSIDYALNSIRFEYELSSLILSDDTHFSLSSEQRRMVGLHRCTHQGIQ